MHPPSFGLPIYPNFVIVILSGEKVHTKGSNVTKRAKAPYGYASGSKSSDESQQFLCLFRSRDFSSILSDRLFVHIMQGVWKAVSISVSERYPNEIG
jgi:hypothetical protein